jgi:hypothetical protein
MCRDHDGVWRLRKTGERVVAAFPFDRFGIGIDRVHFTTAVLELLEYEVRGGTARARHSRHGKALLGKELCRGLG